jgi:hypothetical protein
MRAPATEGGSVTIREIWYKGYGTVASRIAAMVHPPSLRAKMPFHLTAFGVTGCP